MAMQEVKIRLHKGKIQFECKGFQGSECDSIAAIEDSLGTILHREATDEAYQSVQDLPEFVKQGF